MTQTPNNLRLGDSPARAAMVVAVVVWLIWSAISFLAAFDAGSEQLAGWGALAIAAPVIQLGLGLGLLARRSWARPAFLWAVPLLSVIWPGPLSLATIGIQVPLYLICLALLLLPSNRAGFEPVSRPVGLATMGSVIVLAALAAINAAAWATAQRTGASLAIADARACERLVQTITADRRERQVASSEKTGIQALGRHIQLAAQQADLPDTALQGIYPQSGRRMADSPYMVKPTVLSLRRVNLGQIAVFLYHLTAESGLRVRDLRLRSPRDESTEEVWHVEATVTYLIYAPATTERHP